MKNFKYTFKYIFVFCVWLGLLQRCSSSGVIVEIENASSTPIHDIQLRFTGERSQIAALTPGAKQTIRIKTTGESSLEIIFTDAQQQSHSGKVDTYLEPASKGVLHIKVSEDFSLQIEDKTR